MMKRFAATILFLGLVAFAVQTANAGHFSKHIVPSGTETVEKTVKKIVFEKVAYEKEVKGVTLQKEKRVKDLTYTVCEKQVEKKKVKVQSGDWKTETKIIPAHTETQCTAVGFKKHHRLFKKTVGEKAEVQVPEQKVEVKVWVPKTIEKEIDTVKFVPVTKTKQIERTTLVPVKTVKKVTLHKLAPKTVEEKVNVEVPAARHHGLKVKKNHVPRTHPKKAKTGDNESEKALALP